MPKKDPLLSKRIFVGFNSAGAVGIYSFTRVIKERGYKIDFYGLGKLKFGMPADYLIEFSSNKYLAQWQRFIYFWQIFNKYDIWHFNAMESFFWYPLNLIILKVTGKKIVTTFRGSEVKIDFDFLPKKLYQKISKEKWPLYYRNWVINRGVIKKIRNIFRRIKMRVFTYLSDQVVIIGPFLASSVDYYDKIIPYAREIGKKPVLKSRLSGLRILHVATNDEIKGTEFVKKSFKKLAKKYPQHQFIIADKMSFQALQVEIAQADIIIDQLLVGWYGGFAVEAMAKGKVVLSFINPMYLNLVEFAEEIPIISTNPWNLSHEIENLLNSPKVLEDLAQKGYQFVKKYHSAEKIADQYLEIYQEVAK